MAESISYESMTHVSVGVSVNEWDIAEHIHGLWILTSTETVTVDADYIIRNIGHNGSFFDNFSILPIIWTEEVTAGYGSNNKSLVEVSVKGHLFLLVSGFPLNAPKQNKHKFTTF